MTNQHPLTDDIIRYVKKLGCPDLGTWIYTENDLRAAADWQLEQVIEWLDEHLTDCINSAYWGEWQDINALESYLKEAMRPTKPQEDS